jgi:hypothetical protein
VFLLIATKDPDNSHHNNWTEEPGQARGRTSTWCVDSIDYDNTASNVCSIAAVTPGDIPAERPSRKNNPFFCAQMLEPMIGMIGQVVAILG